MSSMEQDVTGAEVVQEVEDEDRRPLTRAEFATAMAHFYRGEIARANVWRQRLDATFNWAVLTTGTTLNECAKALRAAGAASVFALALARTIDSSLVPDRVLAERSARLFAGPRS